MSTTNFTATSGCWSRTDQSDYAITAQTTLKLRTGGKALSKQMNLFQLSGGATKVQTVTYVGQSPFVTGLRGPGMATNAYTPIQTSFRCGLALIPIQNKVTKIIMNQTTIKLILTASMFIAVCLSETCGKADEAKSPAKNSFKWFAETNRYQGEANTNGMACKLFIEPQQRYIVSVSNASTNNFKDYWVSIPHQSVAIQLLDSKGLVIDKTSEGQKYKPSMNAQQLKARFDKMDHRMRVRGFAWFDPLTSVQFGVFSIPELFEVKEPGEYTFKVQVRLIQTTNVFAANPNFTTTWLPEVTAKIQIRSGDIPPANLPSTGQTNSLPK